MLDIIRKRRSVRTFTQKDVEKAKLKEILAAAMFAPTARNLRPCEFIIVTNSATKERLSRATNFSAFAGGAPVVIVICYDTSKGKRFKEDCSVCAENIYLETVNQGLGTCFIQIADSQGSEDVSPEVFAKKTLNVPEHFRILCLMPVGYADKMPEPHNDEDFDEKKVHYETFSLTQK